MVQKLRIYKKLWKSAPHGCEAIYIFEQPLYHIRGLCALDSPSLEIKNFVVSVIMEIFLLLLIKIFTTYIFEYAENMYEPTLMTWKPTLMTLDQT